MARFAAAVATVALLLLATGSALAEPRLVVEEDGAIGARAGWEAVGPTPASTQIDLLIALSHRNVEKLESTLFAVSTPGSERYRQHLTQQQVADLTNPTPEAVATVTAFLQQYGATKVRVLPSGDFIEAFMTVEAASKMLQCGQFWTFAHPHTQQQLHRALKRYTLPASVAAVVDFVGGINRLPAVNFQNHLEASAEQPRAEAGSNAPIVLVANGGESQKVFVAPLCQDGSVPTVAATCDINALAVNYQPIQGVNAFSNNFTCGPCSDFKGDAVLDNFMQQVCTARNAKLNIDGYYCKGYLASVPLGVSTDVIVSTTFNNGEGSANGLGHVITQPYATPQYLKQYYGVPEGVVHAPGTTGGITQAVAEFLGQYYSPSDLEKYLTRFGLPVPAKVPLNGPNTPSDPGLEANLDVQVIISMAEGVPTEFWSTAGLRNNSAPAGNSNQEPFLRWVTRLLALPDEEIPLVNSISYDDDESSMPHVFSDNLNVQFMKAGSRGVSLLFAAGDDGVGGEGIRAGGAKACTVFQPAFPACSPYATAIGGTQMLKTPPSYDALTECASDSATGSIITTGGGFSNRYASPNYQAKVVQKYLASQPLPPAHFFNSSGRAYPDISGIATNYLIAINGSWWQIGGTSASTPLVASMVSLLNNKALASGFKPIGFLNPTLYALGTGEYFKDVTYGNNKCSAIPNMCCDYGFYAGPGFDPLTGLGSPVFDKLYNLL